MAVMVIMPMAMAPKKPAFCNATVLAMRYRAMPARARMNAKMAITAQVLLDMWLTQSPSIDVKKLAPLSSTSCDFSRTNCRL